MRTVTLAALQFACQASRDANIAKAEAMIRRAAAQGAHIILLQELFETSYFCIDQDPTLFDLARPADAHPTLDRLQALAAELSVVLPVSFFERAGPAHFNSVIVFDADGRRRGLYRKSHIPDGPGYQEKFYFSPGDTGFRVFDTRYGRIGVGICWDQWFPEAARAMALLGADMLLYPTAIGSEPHDATIDSQKHWQRTMQGHAAANIIPLAASNRIGRETGSSGSILFYGSSFIAGAEGEMIAQADRETETILLAQLDLDAIALRRRRWGIFRDRRPDLYGPLLSLDGRIASRP
jgi:N-carbamoylputrescine amidase